MIPKVQNMCNFVVRIISQVRNIVNCVWDVDSLNLMFPHCSILPIEEREREREREGGIENKATVPTYFVTLEFLTPVSLVTRLRSKIERKDGRISIFRNCNKI